MTIDDVMALVNQLYDRDPADPEHSEIRRAIESLVHGTDDVDNFYCKVKRVEPDDTAALLADAKVYFAVQDADRIDAARFRCLMDNVGTTWIVNLFENELVNPAEIIARIDAKRAQRGPGLPVMEPK